MFCKSWKFEKASIAEKVKYSSFAKKKYQIKDLWTRESKSDIKI